MPGGWGGRGHRPYLSPEVFQLFRGTFPASRPPVPQDHSTLRRKSNRSIRCAVRVATAGGDREEETRWFHGPQWIPTLFSGLSADSGRRNGGFARETQGEKPPHHVHPASWWHARRLGASKGPELLLYSFCLPPGQLATHPHVPYTCRETCWVNQAAALNGGGVGLRVSGVPRVPNAGPGR